MSSVIKFNIACRKLISLFLWLKNICCFDIALNQMVLWCFYQKRRFDDWLVWLGCWLVWFGYWPVWFWKYIPGLISLDCFHKVNLLRGSHSPGSLMIWKGFSLWVGFELCALVDEEGWEEPAPGGGGEWAGQETADGAGTALIWK